MEAPRLINAIINAGVADALAASVVEPAVARGSHALARLFAFVPRRAIGHVGNGAVERGHVPFRGVARAYGVGLCGENVFAYLQ